MIENQFYGNIRNYRCHCCGRCCDCCCCAKGAQGERGPRGYPGPQGEKGDPGESGPFLSSYIEALGRAQTIADGENFVFDIADNVGDNIEFTPPGTTFTIQQTGLYLIEWSLNLAEDNQTEAHVGLLQNGEETSFSAHSAVNGSLSSGALINVTTVPYTINLNNKSNGELMIDDLVNTESALSIRILRFADGPT